MTTIIEAIRRNGQLTIPAKIRRALHLEDGDFVEVSQKANKIIITPKKLVDADTAWFYTEEWQERERRADEAIKAGKIKSFNNVDDLIKELNS